ncbi:hypothetical protein Moror_9935 [Moniliophthora roreri MCA 2997]|uniref:Uncharacterized protein n=1 Tax=Moniliophthora roreri (strain MCA 2997) TaxID=1381753 RepID=V2WYT1_MONRO|nr:hypothetical protein Moror_9935 [Moniliophthora roreri MCA 2997]
MSISSYPAHGSSPVLVNSHTRFGTPAYYKRYLFRPNNHVSHDPEHFLNCIVEEESSNGDRVHYARLQTGQDSTVFFRPGDTPNQTSAHVHWSGMVTEPQVVLGNTRKKLNGEFFKTPKELGLRTQDNTTELIWTEQASSTELYWYCDHGNPTLFMLMRRSNNDELAKLELDRNNSGATLVVYSEFASAIGLRCVVAATLILSGRCPQS